MMKIGFIGLGNMGGSLARLVAQDERYRSELLLANRVVTRLKRLLRKLVDNRSVMKKFFLRQR